MNTPQIRTFTLHALALAALALAGQARAQSQATTELGKVTVTGEGDKLGTGLMMEEDAAKARSSVTRAQIEKSRSSGNPFQALALLPGVNSSSFDATGLFGGNLRVRGFNSDQMGFTVNGAPVNDSGNFAVYPQEYVDAENLCSLYVTQGAPDAEAPHVGAAGGNVGIQSCAPENERRVRVALSGGQLSYHREFVRFDTGRIGAFKGFVSVSNTEADKWKGYGKAQRKHLDLGADVDLGGGTRLSASLLYNRAVNNNFRGLTQAELATYGNNAEFSNLIPQHVTPVAGTAQTDPAYTSAAPAYYGYALNPFENGLLTSKASFPVGDRGRVDIEPYYWYGYGTGGIEQNTLRETTGGSNFRGGIADINGDGDTLDTVMVYRGSVTKTQRPGVTARLSYTLDNHNLLAGLWFERAQHRQTQPATRVANDGGIGDLWLRSSLLTYADGSLYQGRDQLTVSTGKSVFVQDGIDLMGGQVQVTPGLSYRSITRDFSNYANSGSGVDYQISRTYTQPVPSLSLSYRATDRLQTFVSLSRNFKAPGNFEFQGLAKGVTFTNGVGSSTGLRPVTLNPEKATNLDVGLRVKGDLFRASATAFVVRLKDRIASSYDPAEGIARDINVGSTTTKGLEFEIGSVPVDGFSAYASATLTRSRLDNDLAGTSATALPFATTGKQFPDTPRAMASVSLQYTSGPFLIEGSAKFTGSRYLTLMNDVALRSFATGDINAAYKFSDVPAVGLKNPVLRLNVTNVGNQAYLVANSGSGSNIATNAAGNPQAYAGAPRFTSLTFQADY